MIQNNIIKMIMLVTIFLGSNAQAYDYQEYLKLRSSNNPQSNYCDANIASIDYYNNTGVSLSYFHKGSRNSILTNYYGSIIYTKNKSDSEYAAILGLNYDLYNCMITGYSGIGLSLSRESELAKDNSNIVINKQSIEPNLNIGLLIKIYSDFHIDLGYTGLLSNKSIDSAYAGLAFSF